MILHPRQSTCVAIGGRALLIEGAPGIGKSSLALALIDRGACLVGDDSMMLHNRDERLFAQPHPNTRGLLEVRNLGLLPFPCIDQAPVALFIRLAAEAPRYLEQPETIRILGCALPSIALDPTASTLAIKAELALDRFGIPDIS